MSLAAFITAAEEHDLRVRVVREPSGEPGMRWLVMAEGDPLAGYVVSPIAFGQTADDAAGHLLRRLQQAGALRPAPAEIVEGDQGDGRAGKSRHTPASDAAGTLGRPLADGEYVLNGLVVTDADVRRNPYLLFTDEGRL